MIVSFLPDRAARSITTANLTLEQLAERARTTIAPTKAELEWVKLARFGEARTPKGSLRHNANILAISGIEGDYDGEQLEPNEAADILVAAGIEALIYTSPSHHPVFPRWRVLCPLSQEQPAGMRAELVARVNHILGGVLATESFTLSQGFYIGGTATGAPVETYITHGRPIDTIDGPVAYPVQKRAERIELPQMRQDQTTSEHIAGTVAGIHELFGRRGDIGRHQTLLAATFALAPFVLSGHLSRDDAEQHVADAMEADGRTPNPGEVDRALDGALDRATPYFPPTNGEEFGACPPPPRHRVFVSRDFKLDAHQGYVVKGLLAPGNVGVLLGPPGAGKSTLAPFLAYSVAQGRSFFGLRTKPGRTLIAAAEDAYGMQRRVAALGARFGHSDDCAVCEADGLRDPARRTKLLETIEDFPPSLVILDTIAAAFAGMDENSSQDMGEVVAFARQIAARGPAVLLIHHPAKAGDGSPRGHSSLNGTLDMVLSLAADDVTDPDTIVRGTMGKNRNGSTAWRLAFRKDVIVLGHDDEGDAITTTLPVQVDEEEASRAAPPRLSPQEAAAVETLSAEPLAEEAWIERLASLSTATKPEDRTRSARRIHAKLVAKGPVELSAGRVRMLAPRTDAGPTQGAEFLTSDQPDQHRTEPGRSGAVSGRTGPTP